MSWRLVAPMEQNTPKTLSGIPWLLGAYGIWGMFPLLFKTVASVPPDEVLTHRLIWTVVAVSLLVLVTARYRAVITVMKDRRLLGWMFVSGSLVAINWLAFVWAVSNGRVLESSLGYYIAPLVTVSLGVIFLQERLSWLSWTAVGLAAVAVVILVVGVGNSGDVPWAALVLAVSWGSYGIVRKVAMVGPIIGLSVETALLLPFAILYLVWIDGGVFFDVSTSLQMWMVLTGVVTAIPLLLYARAVKMLPMSTVGLLQYLVPTGHFLLAVLVFHEAFTMIHAVTFSLIWSALALSTWSRLKRS